MSSATDELRRLLDERGAEWMDDSYAQLWCTVWHGQDGKQWRMTENQSGMLTELKAWQVTPEQAIAATLGSEREKALKPCPFCGGEADISDEGIGTEPERYWAYCSNPACFVEGTAAYATEAEAIAAWNSRAERTCHNASYRLDESRFHCSVCGFGCWVKDVSDGRDKLPNYCPNCGAKVVDA